MNPYKMNPYKKQVRKKRGTWSKPTTVNGNAFRSSWEWYVSKLLDSSGLVFLYEPKRFYFPNKISYLPDFYLKNENFFLEVKGWMREKDIVKINTFKERTPFKLVLLDTATLSIIFGFPAAGISKLDLAGYTPNPSEIQRFKKVLGL